MNVSRVVSALAFAIPSAALAQNLPTDQVLNLSGYTQTVDIGPGHMPPVCPIGNQWYGAAQLPPQPFTSSNFGLCEGLPLDAVQSALAPTPAGSLWSGYYGEYETYPNQMTDAYLQTEGVASPIADLNGALTLTAVTMPPAASATLGSSFAPRPFYSGSFNSYPFSQEYGYFEITAALPIGQAAFPAFWLVPENMNQPGDTEIDVVEGQGNNDSVFWQTLHSTSYPSLGSKGAKNEAWNDVDLSQSFHRYGVDWEANTTTFYVDGYATQSYPTPADMHQPMFFIANLAVGGWNGGPTSATPAAMNFIISAIRVWQK